jgi:DNA-binding transcriptional ArsR family regulator
LALRRYYNRRLLAISTDDVPEFYYRRYRRPSPMAAVESEARRALRSEIESPTAKLVYLSLAAQGRASVEELQERLGEPRITLLGVLDSLVERGVVEVDRESSDSVYAPT